MSIQHRNRDKTQETPPGDAQSVYTADTVQREKVTPPMGFPPPPPQRPPRPKTAAWLVFVIVAAVLALILGVGSLVIVLLGQHPATPSTQTPSGIDTKPSPSPGVVEGPQKGPQAESAPAYWDRVLATQGTDGRVESVSFANILGTPTLQALVTVRHSAANSTLDVYVYDKIASPHPTQLFKLQGLVKGDAKISGYNTVLTAEVDQNSTLNAGKSKGQWTLDLCREFAWDEGKGALLQVAFPGLFPDLTRYQAEADQASVNQGHQSWKNDPAQVAKALATQFFQWNRSLTATVTSGGGTNDVYATVKVSEAPIQGTQVSPSVNVTLSRLEGNTHNLWVAIAVADEQTLTIQNIDARSQIPNPVKIEGRGNAFESVIGKALILDHLYNDIGHAQVTGLVGMANTTYSTMVLYSPSFHNGVQEGIVEVQGAPGGLSNDVFSAVMVKVLLTPEPSVTLGPLPGPDQQQNPQYWEPIIGVDTTKASVGTPSFANMKNDTSLQALVPVYHTDGGQVDIYVYDQITSAQPVQLFKLEGLSQGRAMISQYSTILTGQIDPNSSVNKEKTGDQLTIDLYREFKWSDGAGIFVQTAFPGIFPDLTRYQAEMDQYQVKIGQDTWKNDAQQVAQRMAAQLLKWPANATTSIVSGGGSQDIDAVVQVKGPSRGDRSINVTLSRLNANASNMWNVIGVTSRDGSLTIKTPVQGERLTSPTTITGTGSAFEGVIGQAFVLDHLYSTIGQAQVLGTLGMGQTTYSTAISYTSSFHDGVQEGIVVISVNSPADGLIATAVMQKVMLSA